MQKNKELQELFNNYKNLQLQEKAIMVTVH